MAHEAMLGPVEVPVTFSPQEAVGIIQDAGVVGAGGAGFPAFVKYQKPAATLIVNACESEPGHYCDKLLLRDGPELFSNLFDWMADTFSIERFVMAAEDVAKPYLAKWEEITQGRERIETVYVPPLYKLGEEKALIKKLFEVRIPQGEIPPQHGFIVNNVETLYNIYRAVFDDRAVLTKFVHVFGEGIDKVHALEAPLGASLRELLRLVEADTKTTEKCRIYDGGPMLGEVVADPLERHEWIPVSRTTNAFLAVHPDKDRPRSKHYPDPAYKHNTIDVPWAATTIRRVVDDIDRVRVPLTSRYISPGRTVVKAGDHLERGDVLVTPDPKGLSIGAHASIAGRVTEANAEYVEIHRNA